MLACLKCGHKLQSRHKGGASDAWRPGSLKRMGGVAPQGRGLFLRTVEVLGVASALLVALGYGLSTGIWWPVVVAGTLALGVLVLRK